MGSIQIRKQGAREAQPISGAMPVAITGFVKLDDALAIRCQRSFKDRRNETVIYALVDPRDNVVRYIGKTKCSLSVRLERHLETPTNPLVGEWLRTLKSLGNKPRIHALEVVPDDEWEDAERGWIRWAQARGVLFNVDPGGVFRDQSGRKLGVTLGTFRPPTKVTQPSKSKLTQMARRAERLDVIRKSTSPRSLSREEIARLYPGVPVSKL